MMIGESNIYKALKCILKAAPGISIISPSSSVLSSCGVYFSKFEEKGTPIIAKLFKERREIKLSDDWYNKKGIVIYNFLQAVGFCDELDPMLSFYNWISGDFLVNNKYKLAQKITKCDPMSIMKFLKHDILVRSGSDEVWKLNNNSKRHNKLSELDKVALNLYYPPAEIEGYYEPKLGKTGLYYGGRQVMKGHNYPGEDDLCDGFGGPDNGPNGPSCRTLKTDKMDKLNKLGIFQGYSGMIYGGKYMGVAKLGHDGYCGPDNGPSCYSCSSYLD